MPKKLVYEHGINDSDEPICKQEKINGKWKVIWRCPIYTMWRNILERCYSQKLKDKFPTYKDCTIHEEWLYFSNFKSWVLTQPYQNRDIDKDLLYKNNKHYSPHTCIFVPHEINTFILQSSTIRGDYALGVSYNACRKAKPFYSYISVENKKLHLGVFDNEYEAHLAWQHKKIYFCNQYIEKYTDDKNIILVLEKYRDSIQKDIDENRFTI
ncbi:HNH endonuclease [Pectobacterium phage vB_PcaM_CBB]|uniref:DNA binding protein n=1 Tax=Pectobacterium phage vB_PcaM_CBB TaxID=2772511 RepID=A0A1L2CV47_9CAUD|nr:HNH endonuclease [Pectobacterium phage vB_PcaM_CBB]AMM43910.1 hypothetical protein CBB_347 [Pectobacterium phage vB_PcaM_CBB]